MPRPAQQIGHARLIGIRRGAADGGIGQFRGGEGGELPGGETIEPVVHADVVEAELGAGSVRAGYPVVAPKQLDIFLAKGGFR